jgi:hypothetical protein
MSVLSYLGLLGLIRTKALLNSIALRMMETWRNVRHYEVQKPYRDRLDWTGLVRLLNAQYGLIGSIVVPG